MMGFLDAVLHLNDPIVWLRVTRAVMLMVGAWLMFFEPMLCGGANTPLHRLLAAFLAGGAFESVMIARARAVVLQVNPAALAGTDLIFSEIVFTSLSVALAMKLGYDYNRYRQYQAMKCQKRACDDGVCTPNITEKDRRAEDPAHVAMGGKA